MKKNVHYSRKTRVVLSALLLGSMFSYGIAEAAYVNISTGPFPYVDSNIAGNDYVLDTSTPVSVTTGASVIKLTNPNKNVPDASLTLRGGTTVVGNAYQGNVYIGDAQPLTGSGTIPRITVNVEGNIETDTTRGYVADLWGNGQNTYININNGAELNIKTTTSTTKNSSSFNLVLDNSAEGINEGKIHNEALQLKEGTTTLSRDNGFSYNGDIYETQPKLHSVDEISAGVLVVKTNDPNDYTPVADNTGFTSEYKNIILDLDHTYPFIPNVQFVNNINGRIEAPNSIGILSLNQDTNYSNDTTGLSSTIVNKGTIEAKYGMSAGYINYDTQPDAAGRQSTAFTHGYSNGSMTSGPGPSNAPLYNINYGASLLINDGTINSYGNAMEVGSDSRAYNLNNIDLTALPLDASTVSSGDSVAGMVANNAYIYNAGNITFNYGNLANHNAIGLAGVDSSNIYDSGKISLDNYHGSYSIDNLPATGIYAARESHVFLQSDSKNPSGPEINVKGTNGAGIYAIRYSTVDINSNATIDTEGEYMPGIGIYDQSSLSNMTAPPTEISTHHSYSPGVEIRNFSQGNFSANIHTLGSEHSNGITVEDNSHVWVRNSFVNTVGANSHGMQVINNSSGELLNGQISTSGGLSNGFAAEEMSNGNITNSQIETNGGTSVGILSSDNSTVHSALNIVRTSGSSSPGISSTLTSNVYATGNHVETNSNDSPGAVADKNSFLSFVGGTIITQRENSQGVLLNSSRGEITGSTITTSGSTKSQGIKATNGSNFILNPYTFGQTNTITTSGSDSSGIEVDTLSKGFSQCDLDITVAGENSHGIYLHDDGEMTLNNDNTTITGNGNNTTAGMMVGGTSGTNTLVDNSNATTINMTNGGNGIESLKTNSTVTMNANNYDVNLQIPSGTATPVPWAFTVSDGGVINLNGQQGNIKSDNQATSVNSDTAGFGFISSTSNTNLSAINVTTPNLMVDIQGGDGARITSGSLNILSGTTTIKEHTDATSTANTWRSAVENNADGTLNVASGATLNLSHDRTGGTAGQREAALNNSGNAKANIDGTLNLKVGNGSGSVDSSALRTLGTSEVTLGPTSVVTIEGLADGFNGIDTAATSHVNGTSIKPITITTTGADSNAIKTVENSQVNLTNTPLAITMPGTNNRGITTSNTSHVNLTNATGVMTLSGADSMAIEANDDSQVDLTNTPVTATLSGTNSRAIKTANKGAVKLSGATSVMTLSGADSMAIEATDDSRVDISGTGLQIELTGTNPVGISAANTAEVKVEAPTNIKVPANEVALKITDSGKISLNASEANDVVIEGNLVGDGASTGGTMDVNLTTAASKLTGSTAKGTETINLKLDNNALWNVTGTSTLSNLNINNGGLVDLTYTGPGNYNTITTEKLSGNNGKIMFTTDIQASHDSFNVQNNSAKLIITGDSSGEHKVSIKDASLKSLQQAEGYLMLVEDKTSGGATFKGEALESGGIFRYNPELIDTNPADNIGKVDDADKYTGYNPANARNWYLTGFKIDPEEPFQPGMKPNLASSAERYMNYWRELDSLLLRLGELRDNPNASGIWARIKHGEESINNIGLDSGKYTMFQVGYDHKYAENANGKRYWGLAFDHIDSNQNYTVNAKGDSSINSLSLYDTWLGNKGHYLDIVAKAGRMNRDFDYFGNFPDNGESKNWYYSLSGEYGRKIQHKNGFYMEPQAQLTLGRINSSSYTTGQQNISVVNDAVNSAVLRVGTTVGKHFDTKGKGSNGYAKLFWNKEFGGVLGLHLNDGVDTYDGSENYGSNWWTAGIGANAQLDRATNAYLDLEKSFGGSVKTKWQINAGIRWEF